MREYLRHVLVKCYHCLILLSMYTFIKRVRLKFDETSGATSGSKKLRIKSLVKCTLPINPLWGEGHGEGLPAPQHEERLTLDSGPC